MTIKRSIDSQCSRDDITFFLIFFYDYYILYTLYFILNHYFTCACRYKDDRPYPWPGALSHFILFPESANQTIYTRAARVSDAGIYSCRARNDTDTLSSDISLGIVGMKIFHYFFSFFN